MANKKVIKRESSLIDRNKVIDHIAFTLRSLRENYRWTNKQGKTKEFISHDNLVDKLDEQGISISASTLQMFEKDAISFSDPKNKGDTTVLDTALENIYVLSRFYGVSMDYILGIKENRFAFDNVEAVSEAIGFSREATQTLMDMSTVKGGTVSEVLSDLLEHEDLVNVIGLLKDCKSGIKRQENLCTDNATDKFKQQCTDMADMYLMKSMKAIEPLIKSVIGYTDFTSAMKGDKK